MGNEEILILIYKRRKWLIAIPLAVFIILFIYLFKRPGSYESEIIFFSSNYNNSPLERGTDLAGNYNPEEDNRIINVALSFDLISKIINEFHLCRHYEIDTTKD